MDINKLLGTGPCGRVTRVDVEAAAGIKPAVFVAAAGPAPLPGSTVVPFTTMQAAVSENMVETLAVLIFGVDYPASTDALRALYEKVHSLL